MFLDFARRSMIRTRTSSSLKQLHSPLWRHRVDMRMAGALENLHTLVTRQFRAAKQSKSLIFADTELAVIRSGRNVPFQLRYCPALSKKPEAPPKDSQDKNNNKPKPDPFANPSEDLLVAELDSHIIVLNKYPVIENHFILATKISKPQTGLLEPDDLSIAHACLQAWAKDALNRQPRRLFAFFNSGEHSGASQAHRHIQFIASEDMIKDDPQGGWQLLLDRMTSEVALSPVLRRDPDLPFLHYASALLPDISAQELHSRYIFLLRAAVCSLKQQSSGTDLDRNKPIERNGECVISYNLAMTTDTMAIIPRRSETSEVPSAGKAAGSVAVNGTILGGTLMVKDEYEYWSLKEKPSLLGEILINIGFPVLDDGVLDQTKL